jgi:hypothetical protein
MAAVAQSHIQDNVHPLLRHPRPIKRDSAKAQRMLGLIADSEDALKGPHRERSITTRWLERPMYEHLEVSDVEEEKDGVEEQPQEAEESKEEIIVATKEKAKEDSDSDLLDKWTNPDRPTSSFNPEETLKKLPDPTTKLDTSFIKRRPQPLARPVSYNPQHLLSPEWIASPATMSPNTPGQRPASYLDSPDKTRSSISTRGSCECDHPSVHPTAWTYPLANQGADARTERPISYHPQNFTSLDSPPMQSRPRPTSFATYGQRNRSSTKIASSRGLRNNSYPMNFSRPMSGIAPKAVAGENIENDMVYQRFADDEVGPPTPITSEKRAFSATSTFSITSPTPTFSATPASPTHNAVDPFDAHEEKTKPEKKAKNRWSTIPQALKNFGARRRDSAATQEQPKFAIVVDDLRRANLTEENLHHYETEVNHDPSMSKRLSTVDLIPTPTYSPLEVKPTHIETPLPAPFAPWADGPPSPAATADRRRSSGNSLSPRQLPSRLSVENVPQVRPVSMHSHRSGVALPSPGTTAPRPRHYSSRTDMSASPRPLSRRNTPALERTCMLCKTAKPTWEFIERRITANCWHETSTCVGCLRGWVDQCIAERGWEGVSCPECNEGLGDEDLHGF